MGKMPMGKYDPLHRFLVRQSAVRIVLAFAEVEALIGSSLPKSARSTDMRAWSNEGEEATHPQARAWWTAGYRVWNVDQSNETVTFTRHNEPMRGLISN